jgi:DNA-binding Lrp family transcriptional regulator
MPKALVLATVEPSSEDNVLSELRRIGGVDEAYFSFGAYDVIAKVRSDTADGIKELITKKIRALPEVRATLTLLII